MKFCLTRDAHLVLLVSPFGALIHGDVTKTTLNILSFCPWPFFLSLSQEVPRTWGHPPLPPPNQAHTHPISRLDSELANFPILFPCLASQMVCFFYYFLDTTSKGAIIASQFVLLNQIMSGFALLHTLNFGFLTVVSPALHSRLTFPLHFFHDFCLGVGWGLHTNPCQHSTWNSSLPCLCRSEACMEYLMPRHLRVTADYFHMENLARIQSSVFNAAAFFFFLYSHLLSFCSITCRGGAGLFAFILGILIFVAMYIL